MPTATNPLIVADTPQGRDAAAEVALLIQDRAFLAERLKSDIAAVGRIEDELERRGLIVERITQVQ